MSELLVSLSTKYAAEFNRATRHVFTDELTAGTLSDSRLFVYLVMDQKFFIESFRMFAHTASLCDEEGALIRLGQQIGFLSGAENTYFVKTLAELRTTLKPKIQAKGEPATLDAVHEFVRVLEEGTRSASYLANITTIYVFELVYLAWAKVVDARTVARLEYKHAEWVRLHSGPEFTEWVEFLEAEVVRLLTPETLPEVERVYKRTLELEAAFFDACYNAKW